MRLCFAVLLLFVPLVTAQTSHPRVVIPMGPPPGTRAIWVLQPDSTLAMYDVARFYKWQSFKLPAEARSNPEAISISRDRVVIYAYATDGTTPLRRFWTSNPYAPELKEGASERRPASGGGYTVLSASPAVYFSEDGQRLFWFEHREQRLTRGPDISRDARFLAWTTDLRGENPQHVAESAFAPCKCETGACSETCPEALAWAPPAGVKDFFYVTRWVPGQIGSDWLESAVYQYTNGSWTSHKLPRPVEVFLDAADHGNTYVEAFRDGGCCGWANDTDDRTSVVRNGVENVRFDERQRFRNNNYDVSFYTSNALLSPDLAKLAYTIIDSNRPGEEIRVGSDGKDDPAELERVKNAIAQMPMTEIVGLSGSGTLLSVPHAELVGWLDDARILMVTAGEIKVVDIASGKQTSTGIKADAAKYVIVR